MNWLRMNAVVVATMVALGAVDRVLKTLDDPSLKGQGRLADRRAAVRKIANEIFDFAEIAKRSLARHWQPLSEAQRNEFVGLFADLLERSYISKIETYGGEKIQYTGERMDGDYATVSTRIVTKNGTEVPVDYRMVKRADHWLVYDVSIEGVSLVSSYRTQFNKIIQTSSYNELITKLRTKQDELMAEDKAQKKL
jgi:phospholipid transport system substrate-binding protein